MRLDSTADMCAAIRHTMAELERLKQLIEVQREMHIQLEVAVARLSSVAASRANDEPGDDVS